MTGCRSGPFHKKKLELLLGGLSGYTARTLDNSSLTVALAMAIGVFALVLARHLRLPGVVLLLATGVGLGPDGASLVRPSLLGSSLQAVVGFAVAVILFEGGLHMNLRRLRRQAKPIRRLVTVGVLVSAVGATLCASIFMGWNFRLSFLFGTLVIVTGPTVVTPILRRLRVQHQVSTVLEAEGIFIDAVGAIIAVVALEVMLVPSGESVVRGFGSLALRYGVGTVVGAVGGVVLSVLFRWKRIVPEDLQNILALGGAVVIFQISHSLEHESGIVAAIIAGMVVANTRNHALEELIHFKEQLTALLIATLFVLLGADVRIADVVGLGWPGVLTVCGLMFVVRPMTVFASTWGTNMTLQEKLFCSWLAPRGIVAAAVASLFAIELAEKGIPGGTEVRALVFLVIASTVVLQGLTGGIVASLLGLRLKSNVGYLFLGANKLARHVGGRLRDAGETVVFVDSNPDQCNLAESEAFTIIYGNGLEERTLARAQAGVRIACVGMTPNESVNFLFARKINDLFKGPKLYVNLETDNTGVTEKMLGELGARKLFAAPRRLTSWFQQAVREKLVYETWTYNGGKNPDSSSLSALPRESAIPLLLHRAKKKLVLVDGTEKLQSGDVVEFAIAHGKADAASKWLTSVGFEKGGNLIPGRKTTGDNTPPPPSRSRSEV